MQVNIVLLTVTDTRTVDNDKSGGILVKKIAEQNHKLVDRKIVKDEKNEIKKILSNWLKSKELDVIITTGGTGFRSRFQPGNRFLRRDISASSRCPPSPY